MDYQTREFAGQRVCGIAARVNNSDLQRIGALWQRFHGEPFRDRVQPTDERLYAAYYEYESDHRGDFTMLIGYAVPPDCAALEGLATVELAPGRYAVLRRTGVLPRMVHDAWQEVWRSDLQRRYATDFDCYLTVDTVEVNVGVR